LTGQDRNGIMCCSFNVSQKINIVGHSKGGLDARVFLDFTDTKDTANLIMIGTTNAGFPAAETNEVCAPIVDLRPIANATRLQ
jgi:triacylglycerol esterase/lipase EstA (alpha/beta hydrolase family)